MNKKKRTVFICAVTLAVAAFCAIWLLCLAPTRIAFINYQTISLGHIAASNTNSFIRLEQLPVEDMKKISSYDFVFMNGMGLRITEDQRALLEKAADRGVPVLTTMATNPANNINNLDSLHAARLTEYLQAGGRRNYHNMLEYVRREVCRAFISTNVPEDPVPVEYGLIYHPDPDDPEGEDLNFYDLKSYEAFLRSAGLFTEAAPGVIISGQMGIPDELIASLEARGKNVYPVNNLREFISGGKADSINVAALVNMAHGRLGDYAVNFLESKNIPLFSPLNVNSLVSDWEADRMGMSGGFLSQSVVTPEIDGALRPYALFGHYEDRNGLQYLKAMPDRLEDFVETVDRYIALKSTPNSEKKVAIYYYKGPGQNGLTAAGLEVLPSLYNLLVKLRSEGYKVSGLPSNAEELGKLIQRQGAVFGSYAAGAIDDFMRNGNPYMVSRDEYEAWSSEALGPGMAEAARQINGPFPGNYLATEDGRLAIPRVELGNVVLLPQLAAGMGDDDFSIVHGTDNAPPYPYIASYLWARYAFGADVLVHFGTHGSLEFTPSKQVALSSRDWPDRLVGTTPHLYVYTISNVGEAMIAKRRSYAGIQSYLTPPFLESGLRDDYKELKESMGRYFRLYEQGDSLGASRQAARVKELVLGMGIHRDLRLDSLSVEGYTYDEISRIDNFAEELTNEKITGELYTMGVLYEPARIESSVFAMATDPLAYAVLALDKLRGKAGPQLEKNARVFSASYLEPAKRVVARVLANPSASTDAAVCSLAGITADELARCRQIAAQSSSSSGASFMMSMMGMTASAGAGHHPGAGHVREQYSKEETEYAGAVMKVEAAVRNISLYRKQLSESPEAELNSMLNAMNGGYTPPSPGGDPIVNPNTLPTGRNLYSVNAEATPSAEAWEQGKALAQNTIDLYRRNHNDSIPRKVSYTLWSGEFIETEGATIAQILYMLGVEPVRDVFGRVTDIRLIPSEELGRPRIDVVVQTSGQLRDIAASRLFLIERAVEMAAAARDDVYPNLVAEGVTASEKMLTDRGLSPKDAREASTFRVFGGVGGNYGTGITGMIQSGDSWEDRSEIAERYVQNMGAYYGSEEKWENFSRYAFEAALGGTDVVIQPRQSNTWGALSLDHVYEFMGGLNLAVSELTGKDPDAYLSDYRNHNNMRMQELKEAVGVESRTTIFNPEYIKEKMKGGAGAAAGFAEIVQNTYGWNVTKPSVIDDQMWDGIYEVYVKDSYSLGMEEYFGDKNPAALEEITAVMMETARKGMWAASEQQLKDIAELHHRMVEQYGPSCSDAVCDNAKLRSFISSRLDERSARDYNSSINNIRELSADASDGVVMKREQYSVDNTAGRTALNGGIVAALSLVVLVILVLLVRKRRKNLE